MSYVAQKKNRIIRIPEEKAEEYAKMGYEITNEDGKVVADAAIETIERAKEEITRLTKELGKAGTENEELKAKLTEATLYAEDADKKIADLQKENEELKAKLTEATLYAEDADKKIADLQKENEELKAAIQAQATMSSAAPVSEDSGKKKTTKTSRQSE
ncbi:hypothetical protein [Ruminococcus callidus]|uniref:hypothetical protein n=1 Tax=Ruminococcus callidus TaxID=40519 RepID=UPI0023F44015|nr:hypothetical protein [Ruminococcus callidus]